MSVHITQHFATPRRALTISHETTCGELRAYLVAKATIPTTISALSSVFPAQLFFPADQLLPPAPISSPSDSASGSRRRLATGADPRSRGSFSPPCSLLSLHLSSQPLLLPSRRSSGKPASRALAAVASLESPPFTKQSSSASVSRRCSPFASLCCGATPNPAWCGVLPAAAAARSCLETCGCAVTAFREPLSCSAFSASRVRGDSAAPHSSAIWSQTTAESSVGALHCSSASAGKTGIVWLRVFFLPSSIDPDGGVFRVRLPSNLHLLAPLCVPVCLAGRPSCDVRDVDRRSAVTLDLTPGGLSSQHRL